MRVIDQTHAIGHDEKQMARRNYRLNAIMPSQKPPANPK